MMTIFHNVSRQCSKITTQSYSTSFSSAIRLLHKDLRTPIYNIYGFVRFADEIVDTFSEFNKKQLLEEFKEETFRAIKRRISLNPILNSFQETVNEFDISSEYINAFFTSMEWDLDRKFYSEAAYQEYIYGSAEVVGIMCLYVFCEKNEELFKELKPFARSLGAAFQKVNFLRDVRSDYEQLERTYFPKVDFTCFTTVMKEEIENEVAADFQDAYKGISLLPVKSRFGVYVAYKYYMSLFNKIRKTHAERIMQDRIRIPNYSKAFIIMRAGLKNQLKLI